MQNALPPAYLALLLLVLWLTITTVLTWAAGWYRLRARYTKRPIQPLMRLSWQSGVLGGVAFNNCLTFALSEQGFGIGIMRVFGPFARTFLVPWTEITIRRKRRLLTSVAVLHFGTPMIGTLTVPAYVADRLARAVPDKWPEAGPFQDESVQRVAFRLFKTWIVLTTIMTSFFTIVPRLEAHRGALPPLWLTIVGPAVLIGARVLVQFFVEIAKH